MLTHSQSYNCGVDTPVGEPPTCPHCRKARALVFQKQYHRGLFTYEETVQNMQDAGLTTAEIINAIGYPPNSFTSGCHANRDSNNFRPPEDKHVKYRAFT